MDMTELRAGIVAEGAKAAFDVIVDGFAGQDDLSVLPHEQGFLNSLRVLRGDDFCFAAVPNAEWVLACIRKPELRRGRLTAESVMATFPDARLSSKGEVILRISDAETATRWIGMIAAA